MSRCVSARAVVNVLTVDGAEAEEGDARGDELVPALLALGALHPVLVELDELRVLVLRELRERAQRVLEDLVVLPVTRRRSG